MSEKPAHGTFCWNELMTRDTGKASKFYGDLIGWKPTDSGMPGPAYTLWKDGDNKDMGGMMATPPDVPAQVPAHWTAYIAVDNVDELAGKVKTLGGQLLVSPQDIPNVGRFCVIADPTGASVGLITLA